MDELHLRFTSPLSRDETYEALRVVFGRLRGVRVCRAIGPFVAGFGVLTLVTTGTRYVFIGVAYIVVGVVLVGVAAAYLLLIPAMAYRRRAEMEGPREIVLTDEGLAAIATDGEKTFAWSRVQEITGHRHQYLVWTDRMTAMTVPKRSFTSTDAEERFRSMVRSKGFLGARGPAQNG